MKFHAQVTRGDWDIWADTPAAANSSPGTWTLHPSQASPWGWGDWGPFRDDANGVRAGWPFNSYGYQQETGFIGYNLELSKDVELDSSFSYDRIYYMRFCRETPPSTIVKTNTMASRC